MTDATPYSVPQEPGRWRAIILAALVHVALLAFLWVGVRWQNETPVTIEAEVWSPQPREAAPLPEPAAEPEKEPEPAPVIKETPREEPKPHVEEPPVVKPDIALEQEKKRKALEKKRLEEEKLAKQKKIEQERLAQQKKEREEREAKLKKEQEELAKKKKAEQERLAKLEADKQRLEKEKAKKAAEDKLAAKMRDEEMRRLAGGVTGTGGSGNAPTAQGGRASAAYAARVGAKIKSNTSYASDDIAENSPVEYRIDLLPDGSIRGTPRKLRSSGIARFDEAVLRAIEKSQPFPRDDKTGAVPSELTISHKPKDQ